jgi:hypothetical protein
MLPKPSPGPNSARRSSLDSAGPFRNARSRARPRRAPRGARKRCLAMPDGGTSGNACFVAFYIWHIRRTREAATDVLVNFEVAENGRLSRADRADWLGAIGRGRRLVAQRQPRRLGQPPSALQGGRRRKVNEMVDGQGTAEAPWVLKTPPGSSEYQVYRDLDSDPPALVCMVGNTTLGYHLRAVDDLHTMLVEHGDWMELGATDKQKPVKAAPWGPGLGMRTTRWAGGTGFARAIAAVSGCTSHCRSTSGWSSSYTTHATIGCARGNAFVGPQDPCLGPLYDCDLSPLRCTLPQNRGQRRRSPPRGSNQSSSAPPSPSVPTTSKFSSS